MLRSNAPIASWRSWSMFARCSRAESGSLWIGDMNRKKRDRGESPS